MSWKKIVLALLILGGIALAIYYNLPTETITTIELPPETLKGVVIP